MGRQQKLKALRRAPLRGSLSDIILADVAKRCYEKYGRGTLFYEEGRLPGYIRTDWCPPPIDDLALRYNPETEFSIVRLEGPRFTASIASLRGALGDIPVVPIPGLDTLDKIVDAVWIDTVEKRVAFAKSYA